MGELGRFAEGAASWRKVLATVPPDSRLAVFENCASDFADYVAHGLDRIIAVDELADIAVAHGLNDTDTIQDIVARAFEEIEPEEMVPDIEEPPGYTNGKGQHEEPPPLQPVEFFDASEFEGIEPEPRRWLVKDRIPMRNVTLLSGDGATGKTMIALQLAVVTALSRPDWLGGLIDEPGKVLFFTAEEEREEVHRRLVAIVNHYQCSFEELRGQLELHCSASEDCVLGLPNPKTGQLLLTALYERLRLSIERAQPKLVIIESSADLYGGNEIDRAQVRQFIRALRKWSLDFDCAVLLLSHPSMAGLGSGTGTSGSTAWNNSVRSRMYFLHRKEKDDDSDDKPTDLRELQVKKSNYGPVGESVKVVWRNGVFVIGDGHPTLSEVSKAAMEQKAEEAFVRCLKLKILDCESVCQEETSKNRYAPKIFARMDEAKPFKERELRAAMQRMLRSNPPRLVVRYDGKPSRRVAVLGFPEDNVVDLSTARISRASPVHPPDIWGGRTPPQTPPHTPGGVMSDDGHLHRGVEEGEASAPLSGVGKSSFDILGPEPTAVCVQCGKKDVRTVYLIRDPFRSHESHPLHEECAGKWYDRDVD